MRLFVAIVPPLAVCSELAALAGRLAGVRWTPEENFHLTLRFIGETDEEKFGRFADALANVRVESFVLPVGGVGVFPTRGPAKVIWAGVGHGHTRLFQLRQRVDETLLTVDAGLAVPSFHPHFTVGRIDPGQEPKKVAQFLARHSRYEAPPFRVTAFHLLASEPAPGRPPAYRAVRNFRLVE